MPHLGPFLVGYLIVINVVTAVTATWDKRCAIKRARRVPEATLIGLAALGGSSALLIVMYTIRHKTRKPKFFIGVPCILVAQVALGVLIRFLVNA